MPSRLNADLWLTSATWLSKHKHQNKNNKMKAIEGSSERIEAQGCKASQVREPSDVSDPKDEGTFLRVEFRHRVTLI